MNCIIGSGLVPSEEILLSARRLQMRILSVPFLFHALFRFVAGEFSLTVFGNIDICIGSLRQPTS